MPSPVAIENPSANGVQTLGQLYLRSEAVSSPRVVVQHWTGNEIELMPGWRFFRQIIRLSLYMHEVGRLTAGDCVVTLSPLCIERLVLEWAAVTQGAVAAPLDPSISDDDLSRALEQLRPRVVLVRTVRERDRVAACPAGAAADVILVVDGLTAAEGRNIPWSSAMDRGGTLDTAERAQQFRERARAIAPSAPAVAFVDAETGGAFALKYLSHGDMVERLHDFWRRTPSRPGDIAYVMEHPSKMGTGIALWGFVADGHTTIALGTAGREAVEAPAIRPNLLVAPAERVVPSDWLGRPEPASRSSARGFGELARRLRAFAPKAFAASSAHIREEPRLRETLTLDGLHWLNHYSRGN